jgi:hypothetical protein
MSRRCVCAPGRQNLHGFKFRKVVLVLNPTPQTILLGLRLSGELIDAVGEIDVAL